MNPTQSALDRIAASRAALLDFIAGLDEDRLTNVPVDGTWCGRDLLAHITSWERTCIEPLRSLVAGLGFEAEEIPDHDAWNDLQAAAWKELPLHSILDDMIAVRQELIDLVAGLPEQLWQQSLPLPWGETKNIDGMVNDLAWHEEEHLQHLITGLDRAA